MSSQQEIPTILVTGASGQLATVYLEELLALQSQYPHKLIAASRTTEKLAPLQEKGVELRKLDAYDPSTFESAFHGVDRVILVSLDTPGSKRFDGHKNLVDSAIKAGVKHILYTSAPVPLPGVPVYAEHFLTEAYLAVSVPSHIGYTFLRNTLYAETLLYSVPGAIAAGGKWILSTANRPRSYVTRRDLGIAGALAATIKYTTDSARHFYELTAAETLTGDQAAKILSEALGTAIETTFVSTEAHAQVLAAFLPPHYIDGFTSIETHTREGYDSVVTNHFASLVGRDPVPLSSWLKDNKALFLTPPKI